MLRAANWKGYDTLCCAYIYNKINNWSTTVTHKNDDDNHNDDIPLAHIQTVFKVENCDIL